MKYKRILLKLSGEALMGNKEYGFDSDRIDLYANEIKKIYDLHIQIAIVIGGGNIFRGLKGNTFGIERVQGDYMGMLATVINGLALQAALENKDIKCKILSGVQVNPVCELTSGRKAIQHLEKGEIVIISGGTGNPFFTTDTAAVLRALEIKADIILKGTRVDGIYTDDPEKNPEAKKFNTLTFDEAYDKNLKIMDMTAFTLCKDNNMPVVVFNMNEEGNLQKIVTGGTIGTLVTN
ncbi:MAG TPA: UMP kinase [Bacteroidales bacterium]|nr:UMP kinase [Bacteroidales bacterium]HNZ43316.1 UMP kinase [Bacteroidales bacterium]HOH84082.1 UMP kinase [Bacteroidales bacterium]HPB25309.1 UMP kinase [Bacteroidales bacterium]HPI29230.1 UMP kinase [Bacteroidales bacterium]